MRNQHILFIVAALAIYTGLSSAHNARPLPYQAHSINDLDLTLQELIKGTENFKFDVSLATKESCEQYSSWDQDESSCGFQGYGMKTCCLALRGDCSQQPVFNQRFNTTVDIVAMISNPKYGYIFRRDTPVAKYAGTKYFAFNFQYDSRDVQATTDFISGFLRAVEEFDLNLEFVTGTYGLIWYYDNKCFVEKTCNEKEQMIADSNIIMQSEYNGPRKRRAQFNEVSSSAQDFCKNGFPDYAKVSDIPLQFWEPSYQDEVLNIFNTFWNSDCKKDNIQHAEERFKITSNLNSENIATFLQRPNQEQSASVQYVPPKLRYEQTSNGVISHNRNLNITFVARKNLAENTFELLLHQGNDFSTSLSKTLLSAEVIQIKSTDSYVLIGFADHRIELLKIDTQYWSLEALYTMEVDPSTYAGSDLLFVNNYNYNQIGVLVASYEESNEFLRTIVFDWNESVITAATQKLPGFKASEFAQISASVPDNDTDSIVIVQTVNKLNESNGVNEIFFIYSTIDILGQIYSEFIISSLPLHFGQSSSLQLINEKGRLYFVQASGNGSSWSGVFINNGGWCKCTLYREKEFVNLRNVEHTITYMWGTVSDLAARIRSNTFINSCDPSIISAKVFNGHNPQIAVIDDVNHLPTAYVLMDYVHFDELPLITNLFLGSNTYEPEFAQKGAHNTEIVSFDLVEYPIFEILSPQNETATKATKAIINNLRQPSEQSASITISDI